MFSGMEVDEQTKRYIEKRLERIEKFIEPEARFEVEVDSEKRGQFRVEVMVVGPHSHLRAEETTESVEGSIDTVVDELEAQIAKKDGKERDMNIRQERSLKKKLTIDEGARF